ncbi:olfactory receptor 11A1-like [Centroberyx affinis]|uniref:olfactory receptor 11A1-like n=1 Tax=Centroberyx affinis TaxID=166261 RepID=UPI003A5BB94D
MTEGFNETYLTLAGHTRLYKRKYVFFFMFLTVYIFASFTDSLIVFLICSQRSLHKPMYVFIAALLLNSLACSTAVYPKLLSDFLSERPVVSRSACLCQAFVVYSLGGSGFMLLSVMAFDRYVSICEPLRYATLVSPSAIAALLLLAWLLPAGLLAVAALLAGQLLLCRFQLDRLYCDIYSFLKLSCGNALVNDVYGLLCTVVIVFLPIVFVLFSYGRILLVCLRQSGSVRGKAVRTCLPHLLIFMNYSVCTVFELVHNRLQADVDTIVPAVMSILIAIITTLFNPMIYGLKMQEISKQVKKLLCYRRTEG